jgi:peptidoglycan/LPS O-acetylase OafA/YrhL
MINNFFYKKATFTDSSWAILAFTRFLLAFLVMISLGHLTHLVVFSQYPLLLQKLTELAGKCAVIGFLFISGISIGYSYFNKEEGFLKRRFLRIYPLYFFAALFGIFLQYYFGTHHQFPGVGMKASGQLTSLANLLLLQGIAAITISYNGPLWSISVEFFFYLMVPLLFRIQLRYVYLILICSMIFFTFQESITSEIALYGARMALYAWPFILGFLISAKNKIKVTIPFLIIGTASIIYNDNLMPENLSWLTYVSVVLIVFFSLFVNINLTDKTKRVFNFLGDISYPMYLFHMPLYFLLSYLGLHEAYMFTLLVIIIVVPINYVFDDYLKKIFWKPLIDKIETLIKEFILKRYSNKISEI